MPRRWVGRGTRGAGGRRAAPSCGRTRRCRYCCPDVAGVRRRARRAPPDRRSAGPCRRRGRARHASARSPHRGRRVSTSTSPSASVARIGLPIASASNTVSGVPSHSDGKTLRSNAETTRAMSRAKPANTKRSPSPSAWACCSSAGRSGPSPTTKNLACGPLDRAPAARRRRGSCCPSSRAAASPSRPRSHPARSPARRAPRRSPPAVRTPAELLERHAEIDDLDLVRRQLPRARSGNRRCCATRQSRCR